MGYHTNLLLAAVAATCLACASRAYAGRYEQLTKKFAQGPHMTLVGATFYGAGGDEGFVAAGELHDGRIAAVGNAWGPKFPVQPHAEVLGKGKHTGGRGSIEQTYRKRKQTLTRVVINHASPDQAGFVVWYDADFTGVRRVVRLDWGVGRFSSAAVTPDGKSIYILGVAGPAFSTLKGACEMIGSGDGAFVMKMSADGKPQWASTVGTSGTPDRVWIAKDGGCYFQTVAKGMYTLVKTSATGASSVLMSRKGHAKTNFKGVDPSDGGIIFGGDRNTNTGREPWRQPYLYKYDAKGEKLWALWEWSSKGLRDGVSPGQGLVSDSSITCVAFGPNGDMVCGGWSDGGNSVFTRQPKDLAKPVPRGPMGIETWGAKGASSNGWILRVRMKDFVQVGGTKWSGFIPAGFDGGKGNWPNSATVDRVMFLANEDIAISGRAATGLMSTPNAFFIRPKSYQGKYGGQYAAAFRKDLSNATFCSYLPGYASSNIAATKAGLLVVGQTRKDDGHEGLNIKPPVSKSAAQKTFGGGDYDAHMILLKFPDR